MKRLVRSFLISVMALTPAATPARAQEPTWVPLTMVSFFVAGGIVYLVHLHHPHGAPEGRERQYALDLTAYLATPEERMKLQNLSDPGDIEWFVHRMMLARCDNEIQAQEFQAEHTRRFRYANSTFGGSEPGWRSDRGRVHILYGPPDDIRKIELSAGFSVGAAWKYVEIWEYSRPAGPNRIPFRFVRDEPVFAGIMTFIFASKTSGGIVRQVFSTEAGERIDTTFGVGTVY